MRAAHEAYTAKEIIKSMEPIDYFVAEVGTGGTITGVGETLNIGMSKRR
ncbi:MAG: hypothetical protein ACTS6G_00695 [Candidatus Hodgkinia cicadicola]